jgi:hypothetical protein
MMASPIDQFPNKTHSWLHDDEFALGDKNPSGFCQRVGRMLQMMPDIEEYKVADRAIWKVQFVDALYPIKPRIRKEIRRDAVRDEFFDVSHPGTYLQFDPGKLAIHLGGNA